MRICTFYFIFFLGVFPLKAEEEDSLAFFFWNVENLFYPEDDSLKLDDDFTPRGERFWTWQRYYSKTARIWKTIIAAGNSRPPPIICLAEVENRKVMEDLFVYSPAGKFEFDIIHEESDDRRGIDLACAYDPEKISLQGYRLVKVPLEEIGGGSTRGILFIHFQWKEEDIYLFVNHWPSKYGGPGLTEKFRQKAANVLVRELISLQQQNNDAKIICIGDFNDTRDSRSLGYLMREADLEILDFSTREIQGSLKYQGEWQFIDHVFMSKNLHHLSKGVGVTNFYIFHPGFLLEADLRHGGRKPFRTWQGYIYREGFSDHLPLVLILSP